jgi:uncharacterized protein
MIPFFFGSYQKQLFGIYHPANSRDIMSHGVLLCPPVGHEHLRTYMAFRQLALQLSALGFDVLKFDYYGIGDSAGETEDGSVDIWIGDVQRAYQELKDMAGVQSISLVGLRLGATLAVEAVSTGLKAKNLVLWDPVVAGRDYIRELRELTKEVLNGTQANRLGNIEELVGFPYAAQNISLISNLDLLRVRFGGAKNTFLVLSEEKDEYLNLFTHIESTGCEVEKVVLNSLDSSEGSESKSYQEHEIQSMVAQWSSKADFNQALIDHFTISYISTLLKKQHDRKSI